MNIFVLCEKKDLERITLLTEAIKAQKMPVQCLPYETREVDLVAGSAFLLANHEQFFKFAGKAWLFDFSFDQTRKDNMFRFREMKVKIPREAMMYDSSHLFFTKMRNAFNADLGTEASLLYPTVVKYSLVLATISCGGEVDNKRWKAFCENFAGEMRKNWDGPLYEFEKNK